MAQKTTLSPTATPGKKYSFSPKTAAAITAVLRGIVTAGKLGGMKIGLQTGGKK